MNFFVYTINFNFSGVHDYIRSTAGVIVVGGVVIKMPIVSYRAETPQVKINSRYYFNAYITKTGESPKAKVPKKNTTGDSHQEPVNSFP